MNKFPDLSFVCPMRWDELRGSEQGKFCDKCGHNVTNLSELSAKDRDALLLRAKEEKICVAFYRRLSGEYVTPDTPLTQAERSKIKQFGLAALSAGALAIVSGCASTNQDTKSMEVPGPTPDAPVVIMSLGIPCMPNPESKVTEPDQLSKPASMDAMPPAEKESRQP